MSTTTPNLGLFKYNTTTDTAVPFSIDNALNANWDIIDQRCGNQRNIGEIVSSTIPLTDAGLHLLDGALIQDDGIYSAFVDYMAQLYEQNPTANYFSQPTITHNYTIIGSLNNNDDVLSGFGVNNYVQLSNNFTNTSTPWEINLKFTTGSVVSGTIQIIYTGGFNSSERTIWIANNEYAQFSLALGSGSSGAGYNIMGNGTYTIQPNTDYWLKIAWDGSTYTLEYSIDGETFITDISVTSSTAIGSYTPFFGTYVGLSNDYTFKGSIDFNECSIISNNSLWWEGVSVITAEENWQESVTNYGVCGKFVYDSVNNTVRLPKYSDKIYTQELDATAPVVGNGMSLGLTNGTVNTGLSHNTASPYHLGGAPTGYGASVGANAPTTNALGSQIAVGITSDASYSGIIAQLSNITTALDGYYYIVVATTTKTEIEVDIDNIATDLNGKADTDGSNMVSSVKNFDGQWVSSFLQIANTVTWKTNTAEATYSLANYLPNDNYNYEVLIIGTAATGSTSGNFVTIGLNSDLIDNGEIISICEARTRTASTIENRGNAIIPIGTGRYIKQYSSSSSNANGTYSLWALGYRRIGTNS